MERSCGLNHLFMTVFLGCFSGAMVVPSLTDVTLAALCPGEDECSFAIYLTGIHQAIIGLGSLVMMPLLGNLSDIYGRKVMLTVPMTLTIFPLAIMAYSRTKYFFYAYYVLKTLISMLCEGSVQFLALAYVADNVAESKRASVFGVLSGIASAAFVCGNLSARFLSTAATFQVAAGGSVVALVYMRAFLPESLRLQGVSLQESETVCLLEKAPPKKKFQFFKRLPSLNDSICLLRTSSTFTQAAIATLFSSVAEIGLHASLLGFFELESTWKSPWLYWRFPGILLISISPKKWPKQTYLDPALDLKYVVSQIISFRIFAAYYLKAQFQFDKDQFADLMIIGGAAGSVSQLILMPILAPALGEEKLLALGLFFGCAHMFLHSIAWSIWVPYAAAMMSVFGTFAMPSLKSIASKQISPCEQGKAQGCLTGICSFASIVTPLVFSPLTALFLSENAPFYFPGFSIMCAGFAAMIAFIQSIMIVRAANPVTNCMINSSNLVEP